MLTKIKIAGILLAILGSGYVGYQLAQADLVDQYEAALEAKDAAFEKQMDTLTAKLQQQQRNSAQLERTISKIKEERDAFEKEVNDVQFNPEPQSLECPGHPVDSLEFVSLLDSAGREAQPAESNPRTE